TNDQGNTGAGGPLTATNSVAIRVQTVSLTGFVYRDDNNNGTYELGLGETGVGGVTISLSGTDYLGQAVSASAATAADGSYHFDFLRPGTYNLTETHPAGFFDGKDSVGTPFGGSNAVGDTLSNIVVPRG